MSHYKSNVRDQVFNLFEVLGVDKVLGEGAYADLDVDTAREMLGEIARLAEGPIAESFAEGDRNPPVFDPETHTVTLPEAFKKSVRAMHRRRLGQDRPRRGARRHADAQRAVTWALHEHILGANPAVYMYAMGAGFANIFYHLGTEEQKKWAELAAERGWGSTMVLTEPDAGSDVGAGRTKAVKQDDGTWHIDGVKRFITSGDSDDLFENILHLVLARPEGAGPGTKGLSLFFVPKFLLRLRDRRARRAQRRLRHQRRAQDGPEGLRDLRAVASASTACPPWAGWSARCTTASRRCSTSSSRPE